MYGQYKYTRHEVDTNYDALRSCFKIVKQKFSGKKIGLPLIGAGLASGNWETIENIIKEELIDEDVTVVIWEKGNNNPVSI
jgi:O-acetyl-ADP-ribose deacetylase (regulator of RNase III)